MQFLKRNIRWFFAGWLASICAQSLIFKFTGSPETAHIFGALGDAVGLPWFARMWPFVAYFASAIMLAAAMFHLYAPLSIMMPSFDAASMPRLRWWRVVYYDVHHVVLRFSAYIKRRVLQIKSGSPSSLVWEKP